MGVQGKVSALLPAAGLSAFALGCGTFTGGATAMGAITTHWVLWIAGLWFGMRWAARGPGGGGIGRNEGRVGAIWLLAWAGVLLPWLASPVPRAGSSAVVLVPLFLILPWLVAGWWRDGERVRWGVLGVGLALSAVSLWALWGWLRLGTDGASLPLGHHNLLAAFLITALPIAALGWRDAGLGRVLAALATALGVAALLATRSLAGAAALSVVVATWGLAVRRRDGVRRSTGWAILVALATVVGLGAVFGRRLLAVLVGVDPSASARLGYWQAGVRGIFERPWLGWGPGATPWTVHEHFRPVPGVHPPEEVLADLHSLPLQLVYELGFLGCALLAGALWLARRSTCQTPEPTRDAALVRAGGFGLLGAGVMSLAGMPLSVPALPVVWAVALGAVLAGSPAATQTRAAATPAGRPSMRVGMALLVAIAVSVWVIVPRDLAHLAYERAQRAEEDAIRLQALRQAVELDPAFPLYRWRLALATGEAASAVEAAAAARGVAALWLTAGNWDAACRLSHFGAVAPLHAATAGADTVSVTARAVAAQPWLLAAVAWRERRATLDQAVALLVADPRIEVGWRSGLRDAWAQVRVTDGEVESIRRLVLEVDAEPATSLSLHTFRRGPWPVRIADIRLDAARLEQVVVLPPAASLPATAASLFRSPSCRLGEPAP